MSPARFRCRMRPSSPNKKHKTMTASLSSRAVKPIPEGFHTMSCHLVCSGASDAIAFYKKAFGATELVRLPTPNGKILHASVKIGDSIVMLTDEVPQMGALSPKTLKGT